MASKAVGQLRDGGRRRTDHECRPLAGICPHPEEISERMEDIIEGVQTVGTKAGLELLLACLPERHRFIEQPGAAHRQADRGFAMILAAPGHLDQAEAVQPAAIAAAPQALATGQMAPSGETKPAPPGN